MEKSEKETLVSWTQQDLEEGFFWFYTSLEHHYQRLIKRVGGKQNLLEVRLEVAGKGGFGGANCKVPAEYLSETTFSIRKPLTEARKLKLKELGLARGIGRKKLPSETPSV
jgi:hypothetical protein